MHFKKAQSVPFRWVFRVRRVQKQFQDNSSYQSLSVTHNRITQICLKLSLSILWEGSTRGLLDSKRTGRARRRPRRYIRVKVESTPVTTTKLISRIQRFLHGFRNYDITQHNDDWIYISKLARNTRLLVGFLTEFLCLFLCGPPF